MSFIKDDWLELVGHFDVLKLEGDKLSDVLIFWKFNVCTSRTYGFYQDERLEYVGRLDVLKSK